MMACLYRIYRPCPFPPKCALWWAKLWLPSARDRDDGSGGAHEGAQPTTIRVLWLCICSVGLHSDPLASPEVLFLLPQSPCFVGCLAVQMFSSRDTALKQPRTSCSSSAGTYSSLASSQYTLQQNFNTVNASTHIQF